MHVTMTTFLDEITHTLNFFHREVYVRRAREKERETDSLVGWVNYNKSGSHGKMSLYRGEEEEEEKKERRKRRAFDHAPSTKSTPREEKRTR